MKRTQWIDARRNIRSMRASFISICVISLLAVIAYLGVVYSSEEMRREFSDFYDRLSFRDLEISATKLLSGEDLDAICAQDGVRDAEGVRKLSAFVSLNEEQREVEVISLTERIAVPELLSGRLPGAADECALEKQLADALGLAEGDRFLLSGRDGGRVEGLRGQEYRVTGIIHHPDHILSYGASFSPYVLLNAAGFDEGAFADCFTTAFVRTEGAPRDRFGDDYPAAVEPVRRALEDLGEERCALRDEELRRTLAALAMMPGAETGLPSRLRSDNPGLWVILADRENAGFSNAAQNASNLSTISLTLSLLFLAVAVMVIYSCTSRMVEEQSRLVGGLKAEGLHNREIIGKYLIFGLSASLIGVLLGAFTAYLPLQRGMLAIYGGYFVCGLTGLTFLPLPTLAAALCIPAAAILSALFACTRMLRASALELLQGGGKDIRRRPRSIRDGKRLYSRLILLNLRSSLKRVLVTIISVAGCCMLLMVGFTLNYAVTRVPDRQYGGIQDYELVVRFDPEEDPRAGERIAAALAEEGARSLPVRSEEALFRANGEQNVCTVLCAEDGTLPGWFNAEDPDSGRTISLPAHGVYVGRIFLEYYGLSVGETFTLCDADFLPHEAEIAGEFTNYLYEFMLCTPAAWREIFGSEPTQNCLFVKSGGCSAEALMDRVSGIPGFLSMEASDLGRETFDALADSFVLIVLIFIVMAGLMAWFILMNLSDVYMLQKTPELVTMRVNGFTQRECLLYAAAEPAVTTAVGILVGVLLGARMGGAIALMLEQSSSQSARDMDWRTVVFSIVITAVFSLIINAISLRRVRTLRLSRQ